MDMMKPSVALLCKLGSIAVHVDELLSHDGHQFDRVALGSLMADSEVKEWLAAMDSVALLPKKRKRANGEVMGASPDGEASTSTVVLGDGRRK